MPELPEVENVVRSIGNQVKGKTITKVEVYYAPVMKNVDLDFLIGLQIKDITRRGKYILFDLEVGFLVLHLRMTGQVLYMGEKSKHTHARIEFQDRTYFLYNDIRKFGGFVFLFNSEVEGFFQKRLGIEPLTANLEEFSGALRKKKGPLKGVLLEQSVLAGIGNIYGDEILFASGIHPLREANSLDEREMTLLYQKTQEILEAAISAGGSSIKDYLNSSGEKGSFQEVHQVYGRGGLFCYCCGEELLKIRVKGRASVYCPKCQPGGDCL